MDERKTETPTEEEICRSFRAPIDLYIKGSVRPSDAELIIERIFFAHYKTYPTPLFLELANGLGRVSRIEKEPTVLGDGLWGLFVFVASSVFNQKHEKGLLMLTEHMNETFFEKTWARTRVQKQLGLFWETYLKTPYIGFDVVAERPQTGGAFRMLSKREWVAQTVPRLTALEILEPSMN